ncbi:MAG: endonuclease/exonuclease/phosphatase family protein, partial [Planctomycetia bacterium]
TASTLQGQANLKHQGNPRQDTADFSDRSVGNLRADYVLPSTGFTIEGSGIFWPAAGEPGAELIDCSDHRLVWMDLVRSSP